MNCIIIDDKKKCEQLVHFISEYRLIDLAGIYKDINSVLEALESQKIDLIFLDIEIIGTEGFYRICNLSNPPNIIITTSKKDFALEAFAQGVVDYIIKPVTFSRFFRSVDKTIRYFKGRDIPAKKTEDFFIKRRDKLYKLKINDIILVEGLENHIRLFIGNEIYTVLFSMKAIERQLPSGTFRRIHNSYIVNRKHIKTIKEDSLDLIVNGRISNFPFEKKYRDQLIKTLNLIN